MQWYALRSKPNKEEALWREADARGYHVFYPRLRVQPANPRARKIRPYFPGYMFVQADLPTVGQTVFSWLPHSLGLVSFGGEPAEVPDGIIQSIRRRMEESAPTHGQASVFSPPFRHGEPVWVRGGPFAGYEAIFDVQLTGSERVRVFLKFLQARLELPAEQLQKTNRR